MNKKLYFSICISLLGSFFAVGCVLLVFHINALNSAKRIEKRGELYKNNVIYAEKISNVAGKIKYYLVINENDSINVYAIYENGDKKREETLHKINVLTMRESDREMFKKGIVVNKKEDLIHLVEDYTS